MIRILRPLRVLAPTLVLLAGGLLLTRAEAFQDPAADTPLAGIMLKMRGDMKQLRKQLEGQDSAAAWKTVCSVQQHILEAKLESPDMASSKPQAEREAFVNAFRAQVNGLLKRSCDLEAAVLAGKLGEGGEAAEILREMMGPMQKAGHKQFRTD